ncbi:AbrB/MazE/SpoVT family DNA-binding domain-containing protein [uncultured Clostridium sp.]|uniref:AbrB/MazE/SpoVT family DNA-binding domain-containing protein n=1 Tax=uncultured Clostridium sp. TaxID=59620 RepID=UPI0025DA7978|nr:AbrB/MazE/SpoVT family DNA-binding domain-containing protein [uncultured Clostridium sp.]
MRKKVTFNKGGSGSYTGRVILPATYLELMGITKDEPEIEITYTEGQIIIKKVKKEEL